MINLPYFFNTVAELKDQPHKLALTLKKMLTGSYLKGTELEHAYQLIHSLTEAPSCPQCGKHVKFQSLSKGYNQTCSYACGSKQSAQQVKTTFLLKYGVENYSQTEQFKALATNRFGQTKEARALSIKKGVLAKHGVENIFQVEATKQKIQAARAAIGEEVITARKEASCLKKHGVKNVFSLQDTKEKIKQSLLERYGTDYKQKMQANREATNIIKYGVKSTLVLQAVKDALQASYQLHGYSVKRPEVRAKISTTVTFKNLARGVVKFEQNLLERLTQGYSLTASLPEVLQCYLTKQSFNIKHDECGTIYEGMPSYYLRGCPTCAGSLVQGRLEHQVATLQVQVIKGDRQLIKPYELDLYMPEHKLAIEVNGDYYHSDKFKSSSYHVMKTDMCIAQGIELLMFCEHELDSKEAICLSIIKSKLGLLKRVGARKLRLAEVPHQEAADFFVKNHLQGKTNMSYAFGLYEGTELMACMSFGRPRFNKHYDWELLRFACKLEYTIIGGASRLLHAFKKLQRGTKLLTYADRRYSLGKLYRALGFTETHISQPSYMYIKHGMQLSRFEAQKHLLPALLKEGFDPTISEVENMHANKWYRVFDCGNYVFELQL